MSLNAPCLVPVAEADCIQSYNFGSLPCSRAAAGNCEGWLWHMAGGQCQGEQDGVENAASTLLAEARDVTWGCVFLEVGASCSNISQRHPEALRLPRLPKRLY